MKFIKIVLSFLPFLAAAQVGVPTTSACPETKYTFYRQGVQEQQFTKTYDTQGRILTQNSSFSSRNTGDFTEEYTYEYDALGNNNTITFKRNNEVKQVTKKEFDATGKIIKESISLGIKVLSIKTPVNNNINEKIQIFYDQEGKNETLREISTFDIQGNLLKKEVKNSTGKVLISDTKTYNTQGKITQDVHFDAADKVTTKTNFQYDNAGNLVSDKTLRDEVVFAETKNEYDTAGKIIKKTRLNGKGLVDYYFIYDYDASGNMTKENYFYNNQMISVRTFEYDLKGNKIKESYLDKIGNVSMYKTWEFACK